ncbi:hypothetical protein BDD12DRAFT_269932 [Trichophaea hybrida]|nr:hypothetical protein BDD12DRAFT_269932 [Trichophaea hybrida]
MFIDTGPPLPIYHTVTDSFFSPHPQLRLLSGRICFCVSLDCVDCFTLLWRVYGGIDGGVGNYGESLLTIILLLYWTYGCLYLLPWLVGLSFDNSKQPLLVLPYTLCNNLFSPFSDFASSLMFFLYFLFGTSGRVRSDPRHYYSFILLYFCFSFDFALDGFCTGVHFVSYCFFKGMGSGTEGRSDSIGI